MEHEIKKKQAKDVKERHLSDEAGTVNAEMHLK
jgi:hypothetical protein